MLYMEAVGLFSKDQEVARLLQVGFDALINTFKGAGIKTKKRKPFFGLNLNDQPKTVYYYSDGTGRDSYIWYAYYISRF